MDVATESILTPVRYANGIPVSETTAERYLKSGPIELREAFRAGATMQARHSQEEVPLELRPLVNAVRALACRPGSARRTPESILSQLLDQFATRTFDAWTA